MSSAKGSISRCTARPCNRTTARPRYGAPHASRGPGTCAGASCDLDGSKKQTNKQGGSAKRNPLIPVSPAGRVTPSANRPAAFMVRRARTFSGHPCFCLVRRSRRGRPRQAPTSAGMTIGRSSRFSRNGFQKKIRLRSTASPGKELNAARAFGVVPPPFAFVAHDAVAATGRLRPTSQYRFPSLHPFQIIPYTDSRLYFVIILILSLNY